MKERFLVTGGAGFIGSHVCESLLEKGFYVIAVDNFNDYYDPKIKEDNVKEMLKSPDFKLYRVDITDFDSLEEIFKKERIDKVIHLAARAGVRPSLEKPQLYAHVNFVGTINLLELSRNHGVKNFVFASSSSVYGTNEKIPFSEADTINKMISPYAVTKRSGEQLCEFYNRFYDMNIICLRFFTVYGPRGRPDMAPYIFTMNIMKGNPIHIYGDGSTKRDYTYISDIVDGVISSLNLTGFEIINLGNNSPVSLKDFISTIEKVTGKRANIISKEMQPGDVPITYADIKKAKRLLGYEPEIKIEEGIEKLYKWLINKKV